MNKIAAYGLALLFCMNTSLIIANDNVDNNDIPLEKKTAEEERQEKRKQINDAIDITDLEKAYAENFSRKRVTEEDELSFQFRKDFIKGALDERGWSGYDNHLSAMLHGLDVEASFFVCGFDKKYDYEQCSRVRDQEYHAVKGLILSSLKKNRAMKYEKQSFFQQVYDEAKTEYKQACTNYEEWENNPIKENDFKEWRLLGNIQKWRDWKNFLDPKFMREYKPYIYENDMLTTMSGLNARLECEYKNPEFVEAHYNLYCGCLRTREANYYKYWGVPDYHTGFVLNNKVDINIHHISALPLIKEIEVANINIDKIKKDFDSDLENLMETDEGKHYAIALKDYMTCKVKLLKELRERKREHFVHNNAYSDAYVLVATNTIKREPLLLEGINQDIQEQFNAAMENYYQATENLRATEQYRKHYAPHEEAHHYWKYKEEGLINILNHGSLPFSHTRSIKGMEKALIETFYNDYRREVFDKCGSDPLCYKVRDRVMHDLLQLIEQMRLDAGIERDTTRETVYWVPLDEKTGMETFFNQYHHRS